MFELFVLLLLCFLEDMPPLNVLLLIQFDVLPVLLAGATSEHEASQDAGAQVPV